MMTLHTINDLFTYRTHSAEIMLDDVPVKSIMVLPDGTLITTDDNTPRREISFRRLFDMIRREVDVTDL